MNKQPVDNIVWIERDKLFANDYNPNNVFTPELKLLKLSLLEDGWSLPIVVRDNQDGRFEIIDGFHRWSLSADPDVYLMTDGKIPCVILEMKTKSRQMMSTIRYNRARGVHHVIKMADIVIAMTEEGVAPEKIMDQLGMEREEYERLLQRGNMLKRGSGKTFNKGMKPVQKEGIGTK